MTTIGDRNRNAFAKLREDIASYRPPALPLAPLPTIDEAQLVGEVLEWLDHWTPEERVLLQRAFFEERRP